MPVPVISITSNIMPVPQHFNLAVRKNYLEFVFNKQQKKKKLELQALAKIFRIPN